MSEKASDTISVTPGVKLEDLIDFKGDCIDPLVLVIITESLDHALETAARRLKAAGKIYPDLASNPVLSFVKAIRNELQLAPQCFPEGPKVIKPLPEPKPEAKKTEPKVAKTKVKATAAELKRVEDVVRVGGEGMTAEVLELIKDKPDLLAIVKAAVPEEIARVEAKKKERSLPATWGEIVKFVGKGTEKELSGEYESPQALANRLGIITRGAKPDMVKAFQRAGFEVTTNGDERPQKGVTSGFVVKRISETPAKYRKAPVIPSEPVESIPFEGEWIPVKGAGQVLLAYDWIDPVTDLIIPEKRIWIVDPDTGKPTGNKPPIRPAGPGPTPEAMFESTIIEKLEPTIEELAELEKEEEEE